MKKLLLAIFTLVSVGNAFAYKINMMNATDGTIAVEIKYGATGISTGETGTSYGRDLCDRDLISLDAGASKSIDTGACCTQNITVKSMSGSARGKSVKYDAPQTGFGLSCRGFNIKFSNGSNGQLVAE